MGWTFRGAYPLRQVTMRAHSVLRILGSESRMHRADALLIKMVDGTIRTPALLSPKLNIWCISDHLLLSPPGRALCPKGSYP